MSNELMGWQKHLHLREESVWGTRSTTNPDIYIPYTEYSVGTRVEASQADLFTGVRQRRHHRVYRASLMGTLSLPLFGYHVSGMSIAERLLSWGSSGPDTPFPASYTADLFEADTDNKRHLGLRVASMTLSGDARGGVINLALELEGKEEVGGISPPTLAATHPQPVEFLFEDASMYLSEDATGEEASGSEDEIELRDFELRIDNNLQAYHTGDYYPSVIAAGVRAVTFRFSVFKRDNLYDVLRRSSEVSHRAARLVLRGRHLGTASGTFTVVEVIFDRLGFAGAVDQSQLNELVTQQVDWIPLKPSTTASDVDFTFGVEA